jgi:hypothetical protein
VEAEGDGVRRVQRGKALHRGRVDHAYHARRVVVGQRRHQQYAVIFGAGGRPRNKQRLQRTAPGRCQTRRSPLMRSRRTVRSKKMLELPTHDKGAIDLIVDRRQQPHMLRRILGMLQVRRPLPAQLPTTEETAP